MAVTVVNSSTLGIPIADELERSNEIARWVLDELLPADCQELLIDPVSFDSLIPTSNRTYISATGTPGDGAGTVSDPYRVGAGAALNPTLLRTLMLDAVDNRSGDVAIYLESSMDTGASALGAMEGLVLDAGEDALHLLSWPFSALTPGQICVLDGFRPIAEFVTAYSGFSDAGGGVYQVTLDAITPLPNMLRIGAAGQHIHTENFIYKQTLAQVQAADVFGQNRFHIDSSTRVLSVRINDNSDPSSIGLRLTNRELGIRVRSRRAFVSGLRVSGFDAAGSPNNGYPLGWTSLNDGINMAIHLRADFGQRHASGQAYGTGSGPSRFTHYDCEFGIGENISGYTASVSFSASGGCHEVGFRPKFVYGSINRASGQMTILHTDGVSDSGSGVYIFPTVVNRADNGGFNSLMNHQNAPSDAYSLVVGSKFIQRAGRSEVSWPAQRNRAWADEEYDYVIRGDQTFAGVSFSGSNISNWENSRLKVGGLWNANATSGQAQIFTRGGANNWVSTLVQLNLKSCVFDLSSWERSGNTGIYRSALAVFQAANSEPVPPMINFDGVLVRGTHPTSTGFCWFSNAATALPLSSSDITNLYSFSNCVFVGPMPANQVPASGVTTLTEGAWASTDPTTLSDNLATAWLIDQSNLLAAVRQVITARRVGNTVVIEADDDGTSAGCKCSVSVTDTATPTNAQLLAGIVANVDSDDFASVSLPDVDGFAWVFAHYQDEGLTRGVSTIGEVEASVPITSAAEGFYDVGSTWVGGVVPASTDRIILNHRVTIRDERTIAQNGANPAVTINAGGVLAGNDTGKLNCNGNIVPQASNRVQYDFTDKFILEFDNAGRTFGLPTQYPGSIPALRIRGSAGNRCEIRTATGGTPAIFTSTSNYTGLMDVEIAKFTNMGGTGTNYFCDASLNSDGSIANSSLFRMVDVELVDCGEVRLGAMGAHSRFIFDDVSHIGGVGNRAFHLTGNFPKNVDATRLMNNVRADTRSTFFNPKDFLVTNSTLNGFETSTPADGDEGMTIEDSLILLPNNGDPLIAGPLLKNVFLYFSEGSHPNKHFVEAGNYVLVTEYLFDGVIWEADGSDADGDGIILGQPAVGSDIDVILRNCIVLPNAAGETSGTLISALGNIRTFVTVENCTLHVGTGGGIAVGETYVGHAGMFKKIRSSIFWDTEARGYAVSDSGVDDDVPDLIASGDITHNAMFNMLTGSNGVGLNNLEFSSGTPNANGRTDNPQFVNPARKFLAFDISEGGDGVQANAIGRWLSGDYAPSDLIAYIRGGYSPTNQSYKNAAHDGGDIGAVPVSDAPSGGSGTRLMMVGLG